MPKKKVEDVIESDTLVGLSLGGYTVIKSEDVTVGGKEVKKLTLDNGTTTTMSLEVLTELTK